MASTISLHSFMGGGKGLGSRPATTVAGLPPLWLGQEAVTEASSTQEGGNLHGCAGEGAAHAHRTPHQTATTSAARLTSPPPRLSYPGCIQSRCGRGGRRW